MPIGRSDSNEIMERAGVNHARPTSVSSSEGSLLSPCAPNPAKLFKRRYVVDGADGGTRTRIPLRGADFLTTSAFAAALERRSWSGLSLRPSAIAVGAARLVSTPSLARAWLGIGLGRPLAFPDFERFCSTSFPVGTPIEVCCVYRFRHVRVRSSLLSRATVCPAARERNRPDGS